MLVPRHPERFQCRGRLCRRRGFAVALRSRTPGELPPGTDVLVGDTMGELQRLYAAADVAFIGGSLVPHGGQNLLEACAVHVPVVFGPHMFHFEEISAMALERGAARQVHDVRRARRGRGAVFRAAGLAPRGRRGRPHARNRQSRRARPDARPRRGRVAPRRVDGRRERPRRRRAPSRGGRGSAAGLTRAGPRRAASAAGASPGPSTVPSASVIVTSEPLGRPSSSGLIVTTTAAPGCERGLLPARARHHVRAAALDAPFGRPALVVGHEHLNPRVRIRPLELPHRAGQREVLRAVVARERVMCVGRRCREGREVGRRAAEVGETVIECLPRLARVVAAEVFEHVDVRAAVGSNASARRARCRTWDPRS